MKFARILNQDINSMQSMPLLFQHLNICCTNSAYLAALWKRIRYLKLKLPLQVTKTRLSTLQTIFHARHMMEEKIKHNNSPKLEINPAQKIQLETLLIKVRNQGCDLYCMRRMILIDKFRQSEKYIVCMIIHSLSRYYFGLAN